MSRTAHLPPLSRRPAGGAGDRSSMAVARYAQSGFHVQVPHGFLMLGCASVSERSRRDTASAGDGSLCITRSCVRSLLGQDPELHEEAGVVEVDDLRLDQAVGRDRDPHQDRHLELAARRRPAGPGPEVGALDVGLEEDVAVALLVALFGVPEVGNGGEGLPVPLADLDPCRAARCRAPERCSSSPP